MKKKLFTMIAISAITLSMHFSAFAMGSWQQDATGWWWQNDDGSWYANGWQWIDGNSDGVAESYYFDANGYILTNTTTPDNYTVNADGAWVQGGVVQTKQVGQTTQPQANAEGVDADGGKWIEDATGKKYMKPDGNFVMDSIWLIDPNADGIYEIYMFDENGYLCKATEIDYVTKKPSGFNKWGSYNEFGQMTTNYYKGGEDIDIGPYEVVKKNGEWHCVNGTISSELSRCSDITNDYSQDAGRIKAWISLYITHQTSVSGTVYRN